MKPEAQRIKIAEACGWYRETFHHKGGIPSKPHWVNPAGKIRQDIPDYLNDLNAMHEAEKVLTWKNQGDYAAALGRSYDGSFHHVTATAAQRAEAFLRTLNLWVKEKPLCRICNKRPVENGFDHCGNDGCIPF